MGVDGLEVRLTLVVSYHLADAVATRYIRCMFDIQRPSTLQPRCQVSSSYSNMLNVYERFEEHPHPHSQAELVVYEGRALQITLFEKLAGLSLSILSSYTNCREAADPFGRHL